MNPFRSRLALRLGGHFVLLFTAGVTAVSVLAYGEARSALDRSIRDRLTLSADVTKDQLSQWAASQQRDVSMLASLPETSRLLARARSAAPPGDTIAGAALSDLLHVVRAAKPDLQELLILAPGSGRILFSTEPRQVGEYRLRDRFFVEGRTAPSRGPVSPSPTTLEPTLTYSAPIRDSTGELLGVVAGRADLTGFDAIVNQRSRELGSGETYLVDRFHVFISVDRFGREGYPRGVHTEGIDAAVEQTEGVGAYLNYDGVPVIGAYRWLPGLDIALLVEVSEDEAYAPVQRIALEIALVGLIVALLLGAGTVFLARRVARPIANITDAASELRSGKLGVQTAVATKDEVGTLARTFNEMSSRLLAGRTELARQMDRRANAESELRALNAELEQRVAYRTLELEAANEELESFAYSVSHDLRAPLRAINGFTELAIESQSATIDANSEHYLSLVRKNATEMGELIDDLLAFSRLSRQQLDRIPLEPGALAEEVREELSREPEASDVKWTISPMPSCEADPALMKQVFTNLMANAVKFSRHASDPVIEVGSERLDGQDVYYVRDNGVGFDMAYQHRLFGVFQRLHRAEEYEGTGVGLALVHRIVTRHGGRIWAESTPGHGATFRFTLSGPEAEPRPPASAPSSERA